MLQKSYTKWLNNSHIHFTHQNEQILQVKFYFILIQLMGQTVEKYCGRNNSKSISRNVFEKNLFYNTKLPINFWKKRREISFYVPL